jgi:hypothetical protein
MERAHYFIGIMRGRSLNGVLFDIRAKVALLAWFPNIHTQKFFARGLFDTCLQTQLDPT